MPAHQRGIERRAAILRFVREYQLKHGYGPTASQIRDGVGYHSTNIRERHLDKMETILQDRETGRWVLVKVEHPRHIGLIHPTRTDRKYAPTTTFAAVWARGISSLSAQLALLIDEGKTTAGMEAILNEAREVEGWLEQESDALL